MLEEFFFCLRLYSAMWHFVVPNKFSSAVRYDAQMYMALILIRTSIRHFVSPYTNQTFRIFSYRGEPCLITINESHTRCKTVLVADIIMNFWQSHMLLLVVYKVVPRNFNNHHDSLHYG